MLRGVSLFCYGSDLWIVVVMAVVIIVFIGSITKQCIPKQNPGYADM